MKRIEDLLKESGITGGIPLDYCPVKLKEKNKVNLLALGDVGTTVLIGLRLLGADVISTIGICDIDESNMVRCEHEINQINYPFETQELPEVKMVGEEDLFDCDVLVFCASKAVPPLGSAGDVRMAQLSANGEIIARYGRLARERDFKGLVAVVSDPVDPLCRAFLNSAKLRPSQVQGYGLGVMNARALYFAGKDRRFSHYAAEGRAFGPHGEDLVIADSLTAYDDQLSRELTALTVDANMRVRELGFKPYIAPALSSAAISILLTLRGEWHYSSLYLGNEDKGAFLGMKNRMRGSGPEYEDVPLCEELYGRIKDAYENLCEIK